ncbi:MAG: DUF6048 family protein [Cyclobacteriaceae bacterium]
MKFIFNISFLISCFFGFSQAESEETVTNKRVFYDAKVGVNIIRGASTLFGSDVEAQELQAALGMHTFDLVFDYGTEKNNRSGNYIYENSGSYFRFGMDRNFVKDRSNGNVLSLGLRYARANFEDALSYSIDNGFGLQDISLSNSDLSARWMELNFNLRGKIVSNFYAGFTLRWKFARKITGEETLKTFDVPGFGDTKRENATSFDYYMMWRIPFR